MTTTPPTTRTVSNLLRAAGLDPQAKRTSRQSRTHDGQVVQNAGSQHGLIVSKSGDDVRVAYVPSGHTSTDAARQALREAREAMFSQVEALAAAAGFTTCRVFGDVFVSAR